MLSVPPGRGACSAAVQSSGPLWPSAVCAGTVRGMTPECCTYAGSLPSRDEDLREDCGILALLSKKSVLQP